MKTYKPNDDDLIKLKSIIMRIVNSQNIEISCNEKIGNLSKSNKLINYFCIYTIKIDDFETRIKFSNKEDIVTKGEVVGYEYLISRRK